MNMLSKSAVAASSPAFETVVLTVRQAAAARWAVAAFDELAVDLLARPAQAESELFAALLSVSGEQGWASEIARDLGREVLRHPAAESGQWFRLELRRVDGEAAAPFFGTAVTRFVRLPSSSPLSPRATITAAHEFEQGKGPALSFAAYPTDITDWEEQRRYLEDKAALDRADMLQRRMLSEAIAASAQSLEAQTILVGVLTQLKNLGTQIALLQQEASGLKAANKSANKTEVKVVVTRAARADTVALDAAIGKAMATVARAPAKPQMQSLQTMMQGWREQISVTRLTPVTPAAVRVVASAARPPVPAVLVQPSLAPAVAVSAPPQSGASSPVLAVVRPQSPVAAQTAPVSAVSVAPLPAAVSAPLPQLVEQRPAAIAVQPAVVSSPTQSPSVAPVASVQPVAVVAPVAQEAKPQQVLQVAPVQPAQPAQQSPVLPTKEAGVPASERPADVARVAPPKEPQAAPISVGGGERVLPKTAPVQADKLPVSPSGVAVPAVPAAKPPSGGGNAVLPPGQPQLPPVGPPPSSPPPSFHERVKQVTQETSKIGAQFRQAQKKACDNGCGDKCGTAACPIVMMTNRITAAYTNG